MVEPIDIKETSGETPSEYSELISEIDKDPFSSKVWDRVLNLAKREEGTEKAQVGFYGHVPLGEMIKTARRLRETESLDGKYRILAEKSSTGELWYDIILGRTNDQPLTVLGEHIGKKRWEKGLDIGSGPGNSLREIKKHAESFVGLDRLKFLLQVARSHPELSKAQVVTAEALNLPFANKKFNLVISNGLTYYLLKEDLPKFVDEVARVTEPGGSYFEAFTYKDKEEILPFVEREFLKSGKSVLACLMDRLITHREGEAEEGPSHFSILKSGFEERGFSCIPTSHRDEGVLVLEFKKRHLESKPIENLRKLYLMGESKSSFRIVCRLIYGQETRESSLSGRYSKRAIIEESLLPPKAELIKVLEAVGRVAAEQRLIDQNSGQEYIGVFIEPIVDLAISDLVDPEVRETAARTLSKNLERLYEGKIRKHTLAAWNREGVGMVLKKVRELVKDRPGCEEAISQIDTIISESSLR